MPYLMIAAAAFQRGLSLWGGQGIDHTLLPSLVLGAFFSTSGYRKLYVPKVHAQVFGLFASLKVPKLAGLAVVGGEFLGGLGLLSGVLQTWAAVGLLPIMLGAYFMDTLPGIRAKHPDSQSMWISKLMCNAEFMILVLLLVII